MTAENEKRAYIGWTNTPLSESGRKELLTANRHFFPIDKVYCSDLVRCTETANILFPNQSISMLEQLREINFGKWEGKTYEELKDEAVYQGWLEEPINGCPPEGESFHKFSLRVLDGWEKVREDMLQLGVSHSAIVAHGGVMRCLLTHLTALNRPFFEWEVPFGSGYQLIWSDDAFRRGLACTSLQVVPITESRLG